jgi:hypothetical protein
VALILLSDDYGRGRASLPFIVSHVFPTLNDESRVAEYMSELQSTGFFFTYEVRNQSYFSIRNWKKHQRVDKPGKPLVPPPDDIEPPIPETQGIVSRKCVYFIRGTTTGLIKIGESIDPIARLTELSKCGSEELQLLAIIENGSRTERELHAKLSSHRVHGEWFRPSHDVLNELIDVGGKVGEPIATAGYNGANRIRESFGNDSRKDTESLLPDHDHDHDHDHKSGFGEPVAEPVTDVRPVAPTPKPADASRGKPYDPLRASFKTQCPDKMEFTEAHRGIAARGSIDINLEWRLFKTNAHAHSMFKPNWPAAFESHLCACIGRIERAAQFRANGPPPAKTPPVARPQTVQATPGQPNSKTIPSANQEPKRNVGTLLGKIGGSDE